MLKVIKEKTGSLNILRSGFALPAFCGSSLDLTRALAKIKSKRQTKPMILVLHANPMRGMVACNSRGNTMPPTDPPVAAMPVASPLRRMK